MTYVPPKLQEKDEAAEQENGVSEIAVRLIERDDNRPARAPGVAPAT